MLASYVREKKEKAAFSLQALHTSNCWIWFMINLRFPPCHSRHYMFTCHSRRSTGENNQINYGWIVFSCFSLRGLVLCMAPDWPYCAFLFTCLSSSFEETTVACYLTAASSAPGPFAFFYPPLKIFVYDLSHHLLFISPMFISLGLYHMDSLSCSLYFRYIYYFGGLLSGAIKMNSSPLFLHQVLIPSLPNFQGEGGVNV